MTNRPKQIGTKAETNIVKYLRANGFEHENETARAHRIQLAGGDDQGDISVCPQVMIQSKAGKAAEAASDNQIAAWLAETQQQQANRRGVHVAALVTKRKGKGDASVGEWWAHLPGQTFAELASECGSTCCNWVDALPAVRLPLAEFVTLLRRAGYGTPLPD